MYFYETAAIIFPQDSGELSDSAPRAEEGDHTDQGKIL